MEKTGILSENMKDIADYTLFAADQLQVTRCYRTHSKVQLDASAHDQPKKIAVKNLEALFEEYYMWNNHTFSCELHDAVKEATGLHYGVIVVAIKIGWSD